MYTYTCLSVRWILIFKVQSNAYDSTACSLTFYFMLVLLFLLFVTWKVASVNDHDGRSL
jgi:hypothetical protein